MMADARQLLAEALAMLDAASTLEHYEVNKALEPAGKAAKEAGEKVDELRFEFIAVYLDLYDAPNVWGTYVRAGDVEYRQQWQSVRHTTT